jgi:hypothetical protein
VITKNAFTSMNPNVSFFLIPIDMEVGHLSYLVLASEPLLLRPPYRILDGFDGG